MAGSSNRILNSDNLETDVKQSSDLVSAAVINIQPHGMPENVTDRGWRLNPMEAADRSVMEILEQIAHTTYDKETLLRSILQQADDIALSPLCEFCDYIFKNLRPSRSSNRFVGWVSSPGRYDPDRRDITQSRAQLERMATENTCHFCRLRWNQLSVEERQKLEGPIKITSISVYHSIDLLSLEFSYSPKLTAQIHMVPCRDIDVLPHLSISTTNNSSASWALVDFWLQGCVSGHEMCHRLASVNPKLPTRLIDLGLEAYTVRPRLCYSAGLPSDTRYTTLSHRWGKTDMLMLTTDNIQDWTNGLPISKLSLTFKHAMETTKRLGIRYLWIDSLCIVQDSNEDWRRESAAMGDIFRNSYCSISATGTGNDQLDKGLFVQRSSSDVNACVVKPQHALRPHSDGRGYHCFDKDIWKSNITMSPLLSRGWVLQERILAPRILHFSKQQTFWECLELRACEGFPAGIPRRNDIGSKKLSLDPYSVMPSKSIPEPKFPPAQRLWDEIVESYSATELTYPEKDKLAALSGVAKSIGMDSEYLAGIWKDNLAVHLLWKGWELDRPLKYQAPSWSWAAVNGRVNMGSVPLSNSQEIVADILETHVELACEDPTGTVQAGYIRLRGCLAPVIVDKSPNNEYWFRDWEYRVRGTSKEDKISCHPDTAFNGDSAQLYFFLIKMGVHPSCSEGSGLLLEPTGVKRGEFHRRGTFGTGQFIGYDKDGIEPFLNLFRASTSSVDPDHFICVSDRVDPVCGFPMYEISII